MIKKIIAILILSLIIIITGCRDDNLEYFNVSFETFGGRYIESQKVLKGEKATKPLEPTKANYTFINWYEDSDFQTIFLFDDVEILKDTTIYAKFKLNEEENNNNNNEEDTYYKITLDPGLGTLENNILEVLENKEFNLPTPDYDMIYNFLGWFTIDDILFTNNKVDEDITLYAKYELINIPIESFMISLNPNGGTLETNELIVLENEEFVLPIPIHPLGLLFLGWFDSNDNLFTNNTISNDITLYAKYENVSNDTYLYGSYPEAIWIELNDTYNDIEVSYKLSNGSNYQTIDSELIRKENNQTLIDIVGLKEGFYDVKILINNDDEIIINTINVLPHDRSGYAHFNYTNGIGAYKDDGTLKDDAIIVYVTEENKNNITIPGISETGLGWILNNAQYSSSTSNTYNSTKYNNSLAKFNKPVVFRIIGRVSAPEGVTEYNSTNNGGSKGDNGNMARMKDANNITIEGIGTNATIYGWGIHFMASSNGRGESFEVRNLTFDKYPEDALGLEGVQSGNTLTAPVKRGWIHNNIFMQGYSENPAESDKKYGDGSLDIKRGEYFTISYNQFLSAQKSNLIGASDNNLQYHFTYHHNLWYNVNSRIPLGRTANIHMYNNVFMTSDDQAFENSYAQNTRANAYIFSEANYFHATKNPTRVQGGAVKSFNDIKYSTYGDDHAVVVDNRTTLVSSGNKYENFDTNSSVFYYDEINKKSNVSLLTDAFTAKVDVFRLSGVNRKDYSGNPINHYITNKTPTLITESKEYPGGKINKGEPFFVFKLEIPGTFSLVDGGASTSSRLVSIKGENILTGTGSIYLLPGIYVLESAISHGASKGSSQAKEASVTSFNITLDDETASSNRINSYHDNLSLLPDPLTYTDENIVLINNLKNSYKNLLETDLVSIDTLEYNNIMTNFNNLGKTYIETLINNIGVINEASYNLINIANKAYNNASSEIKSLVSNLNILNEAIITYQQYEISNLNQEIEDASIVETSLINDLNLLTIKKELNDNLYERYQDLDDDDKSLITNISKITNNLNILEEMLLAYLLKDILNETTIVKDNLNDVAYLYNNYQTLNNDYKVIFNNDDLNKLNNIFDEYIIIIETRTEQFYHYLGNNSYFSLSNDNGYDIKTPYYYEDIEIKRGLKIESKTIFSFTTTAENSILYISFTSGTSIKINGAVYNITNNELVLDLPPNDYVITRDKAEARIIYLIVTENY